MRKRLLMALAAGMLLASMLPGVASAGRPDWYQFQTESCGNSFYTNHADYLATNWLVPRVAGGGCGMIEMVLRYD